MVLAVSFCYFPLQGQGWEKGEEQDDALQGEWALAILKGTHAVLVVVQSKFGIELDLEEAEGVGEAKATVKGALLIGVASLIPVFPALFAAVVAAAAAVAVVAVVVAAVVAAVADAIAEVELACSLSPGGCFYSE